MEVTQQEPEETHCDESEPLSGYFDNVIDIFNSFDHPIVLVEEHALRWMAMKMPLHDIDLLVRSADIIHITHALLSTGLYQKTLQTWDYRLMHPRTAQVPRLYNLKLNYYLSLWSEDIYMLSVDDDKLEVPDVVVRNAALFEESYDHGDVLLRTEAQAAGYSKLEKLGIKLKYDILARSEDHNTTPIFIPTVPRMLEALFDQTAYDVGNDRRIPCLPRYNISCMIRYLYLEKPPQRERVLPRLKEGARIELEKMLDRFKRKPVLRPSLKEGVLVLEKVQ